MDLVLIRHPQPAIEAGVCYGRTDVPLACDAREAADALLVRLAALDVPIAQAVWTSPLMRCADIAERLARRFGCVRQTDIRLEEMDFGEWECRPWDAIGRAALDAWAADLHHARVHGGESVSQFAARVGSWFDVWRALPVAAVGDCTYVVTHAGVMRMIAAHALALPINAVLRRPVAIGSVIWMRGGRAGAGWQVVRWNG